MKKDRKSLKYSIYALLLTIIIYYLITITESQITQSRYMQLMHPPCFGEVNIHETLLQTIKHKLTLDTFSCAPQAQQELAEDIINIVFFIIAFLIAYLCKPFFPFIELFVIKVYKANMVRTS